jgi:hypothetical protein
MFSRANACLLLLLVASVAGCGSKGAVSLLAHVERPELSARSNALDLLVLSGGFDLVLELGDAAPRSTTVSLGSFSIENEAGAPLVDRLDASPDLEFPVTLGPGDTVSAHCDLGDDQVVDPADGDVCSGNLRIAGVITDSLSDGRPTRVISNAFQATCE